MLGQSPIEIARIYINAAQQQNKTNTKAGTSFNLRDTRHQAPSEQSSIKLNQTEKPSKPKTDQPISDRSFEKQDVTESTLSSQQGNTGETPISSQTPNLFFWPPKGKELHPGYVPYA